MKLPKPSNTDSIEPTLGGAGWRPQLAELGEFLLDSSEPELRRRLVALYRMDHSAGEPEPEEQLRRLALTMLHRSATLLSDACGTKVPELLQFIAPHGSTTEIVGTRARMRRLDRIWPGMPALLWVETLVPVHCSWPGPGSTHLLLQFGSGRINGHPTAVGQSCRLQPGEWLDLDTGSSFLMRHSPLGRLIELIEVAGFHWADLPQTDEEIRIATPAAGTLVFLGTTATICGRGVILSAAEAHVLRVLCQNPGRVVDRQQLSLALGRGEPRALDRILMGLRDKLGDGIISTVYGAGYCLAGDAVGNE